MKDLTSVVCVEFGMTWVRSGLWLGVSGGLVPDEVLMASPVPGLHQVFVDPTVVHSERVAQVLRSEPAGVLGRMVHVPIRIDSGLDAAITRADRLGIPVLLEASESLDTSGPRVVPIGGIDSDAVLVLPAEPLPGAMSAFSIAAHQDGALVQTSPATPQTVTDSQVSAHGDAESIRVVSVGDLQVIVREIASGGRRQFILASGVEWADVTNRELVPPGVSPALIVHSMGHDAVSVPVRRNDGTSAIASLSAPQLATVMATLASDAPSWVLASCGLGGTDGGFAAKLADLNGWDVLAPQGDVSVGGNGEGTLSTRRGEAWHLFVPSGTGGMGWDVLNDSDAGGRPFDGVEARSDGFDSGIIMGFREVGRSDRPNYILQARGSRGETQLNMKDIIYSRITNDQTGRAVPSLIFASPRLSGEIWGGEVDANGRLTDLRFCMISHDRKPPMVGLPTPWGNDSIFNFVAHGEGSAISVEAMPAGYRRTENFTLDAVTTANMVAKDPEFIEACSRRDIKTFVFNSCNVGQEFVHDFYTEMKKAGYALTVYAATSTYKFIKDGRFRTIILAGGHWVVRGTTVPESYKDMVVAELASTADIDDWQYKQLAAPNFSGVVTIEDRYNTLKLVRSAIRDSVNNGTLNVTSLVESVSRNMAANPRLIYRAVFSNLIKSDSRHRITHVSIQDSVDGNMVDDPAMLRLTGVFFKGTGPLEWSGNDHSTHSRVPVVGRYQLPVRGTPISEMLASPFWPRSAIPVAEYSKSSSNWKMHQVARWAATCLATNMQVSVVVDGKASFGGLLSNPKEQAENAFRASINRYLKDFLGLDDASATKKLGNLSVTHGSDIKNPLAIYVGTQPSEETRVSAQTELKTTVAGRREPQGAEGAEGYSRGAQSTSVTTPLNVIRMPDDNWSLIDAFVTAGPHFVRPFFADRPGVQAWLDTVDNLRRTPFSPDNNKLRRTVSEALTQRLARHLREHWKYYKPHTDTALRQSIFGAKAPGGPAAYVATDNDRNVILRAFADWERGWSVEGLRPAMIWLLGISTSAKLRIRKAGDIVGSPIRHLAQTRGDEVSLWEANRAHYDAWLSEETGSTSNRLRPPHLPPTRGADFAPPTDQLIATSRADAVQQTESLPILWDEPVLLQWGGLLDIIPGPNATMVLAGSDLKKYLNNARAVDPQADPAPDRAARVATATVAWIVRTLGSATKPQTLSAMLASRGGVKTPKALTVEVEIGLRPPPENETVEARDAREARETDLAAWVTAQVSWRLNIGLTRWVGKKPDVRALPQVRVRHAVVRTGGPQHEDYLRLRGSVHDGAPTQPPKLEGQRDHIPTNSRRVVVMLEPPALQPTEGAVTDIQSLAREVAHQVVLQHLLIGSVQEQGSDAHQIFTRVAPWTAGPYVEMAAPYDPATASSHDAYERIRGVAEPFDRELEASIASAISALTGRDADQTQVAQIASRVEVRRQPRDSPGSTEGSTHAVEITYTNHPPGTRVDDEFDVPQMDYLSRWRLSAASLGDDGWWRLTDPLVDVDKTVSTLPPEAFRLVDSEYLDVVETRDRREYLIRGDVRYEVARLEVARPHPLGSPVSMHPVRVFRVRVHLAPTADVVASKAEALMEHTQTAVRQELNERFRLPGGDQFHLVVEFTDRADAHHVVEVPATGSMDMLTWPATILQESVQEVRDSVLHEILHLLGLQDEYVESGHEVDGSRSMFRHEYTDEWRSNSRRRTNRPLALMKDVTRSSGSEIIAPRYLWEIAFVQESYTHAPVTRVGPDGAVLVAGTVAVNTSKALALDSPTELPRLPLGQQKPLTDPVVLPSGSEEDTKHPGLYWVGDPPSEQIRSNLQAAVGALDAPVVFVGSSGRGRQASTETLRNVQRLAQQFALKQQQPVVVTQAELPASLRRMSHTFGFSVVHLVTEPAKRVVGLIGSLSVDPIWQVVDCNGNFENHGKVLEAPILVRARKLARPAGDSTRWAVGKLLLAPSIDAKLKVLSALSKELAGQPARDDLQRIVEQVDGDPWFGKFKPLLGELGGSGKAGFVLDFQAMENPVDRNALLLSEVGRGIEVDLRVDLIRDSGYPDSGALTALTAVDVMFAEGRSAALTWVQKHSAALRNDEKGHWVDALKVIAQTHQEQAADLKALADAVYDC
ncbi:hypothetical protein ACLQ24_00815 [Micromonospora sp. DT4]|uniref:hypothetical protein n=1 Tax=Micromonospora sp. DT4 TaxID=3393438 RepID=UPI003CF9C78C